MSINASMIDVEEVGQCENREGLRVSSCSVDVPSCSKTSLKNQIVDCDVEISSTKDNLNVSSDVTSITVVSDDSDLRCLSTFTVNRLLFEDTASKKLCIEGKFTDKDGVAVVIFEQKPVSEEYVKELFITKPLIEELSKNDIYRSYECFPHQRLNGLNATVIYPASEEDIKKNESHLIYIIDETPKLYNDVTLPHITQEQLNLKWIYDILDHKIGQEKIILEDLDSVLGFVLLPHLQWDQKDVEELHLVAVVRPRGIKSLRDLTANHIPLLKNIDSKVSKFIEEKYSIYKSRLLTFLHYQPSYFHLHIHFACISCEDSGTCIEEAHSLTDVTTNIELMPDYYQKANLSFVVNETQSLFLHYKDKGILKVFEKKDI
ncbi:m7GpppX diphosphatase-like [Lycorma delicatula]|uniref:m7GpppX diphosphatase-like n=1 Tax=Lycorma delicatula TaxID=130591 RepID=UPI003F519357